MKGKSNGPMWLGAFAVVVIALAAVAYVFGGVGAGPQSTQGTTQVTLTTGQSTTVPNSLCPALAGNSQSITFAAVDGGALGVVPVTPINHLGQLGNRIISAASSSSETTSGATTYKLLMQNSSYWGKLVSGQSTCDPTFPISTTVGAISGGAVAVNNNDGSVNSGTNLQAVGTSKTQVTVGLTGNTSKAYFTNPDLAFGTMCMNLTGAASQYSKVDSGLTGGATYFPAPPSISTQYSDCWSAPMPGGVFDGNKVSFGLFLAPINSATNPNANVSAAFYGYDYYYGKDATGQPAIKSGLEDDTHTLLTTASTQAIRFTIYAS